MIGESKLMAKKKKLFGTLKLFCGEHGKNESLMELLRKVQNVLGKGEARGRTKAVVDYIESLEVHYQKAKDEIMMMRREAMHNIPPWVHREITEQQGANESMKFRLAQQRKELRRLNRKVSDLLHGARERKKCKVGAKKHEPYEPCPHCDKGPVRVAGSKSKGFQLFCSTCNKHGPIKETCAAAINGFYSGATVPVSLAGEGRHG